MKNIIANTRKMGNLTFEFFPGLLAWKVFSTAKVLNWVTKPTREFWGWVFGIKISDDIFDDRT